MSMETTLELILKGTDEVSATLNRIADNLENTNGKIANVSRSSTEADASMKKLAFGLSGAATAAFNLFNMYDRVNDAQVQLDRSNLMVQRSTESLDQATKNYAATVAKYGVNSTEAKDAADKLSIATDALTVANERAAQASTAHNQALVRMGIETLPTVITMIGSISMVTANYTAMVGGLSQALLFLQMNPIVLVIAGIAALVIGLIWAYNNVAWFRDGINTLGVILTALAGFLVGTLLSAWNTLCSGMMLAYNTLLKPIFDALEWVWNNVIKPIANFFGGGGGVGGGGMQLGGGAGGGPTGQGPTHGQFGGIITKPTLLYAGEAEPEALIPLSKYALTGMGGEPTQHIEVQIVVQGSMDKAVADYAVQKVKDMLKSVTVEATSSGAPLTQRRIRQGSVFH